jgi:hypothetical protein
MAVIVPLDSRQASITRLLLTETGPASVESIASDLKLTSRVVRYNLASIDTFLRSAPLAWAYKVLFDRVDLPLLRHSFELVAPPVDEREI